MVTNSKNIQGVNKFAVRLTPKNRGLQSGKTIKSTSSGQEDFFLSSAPKIPECSEELKNLLDTFLSGSLDTKRAKLDSQTSKRKAKSKITKPKKFNGFFAFRSYYSRSINDVVYQRSLSRKLAQLWAIEPNQDVWNRYAIEYNRSLDDLPFCEWLEKTLNGPVQAANSKAIQENTNSNNNTLVNLQTFLDSYIEQMEQLFENKEFFEEVIPGIYTAPIYNHSDPSNLNSISPMLALKIQTQNFFELINNANTADLTSLKIENQRLNETMRQEYPTRKSGAHSDKVDMDILCIDPSFFNLLFSR